MRGFALALIVGLLGAPGARAGTVPPDAATLSSAAATRRTVALSWTAPGDDGSSGTAASYDLRYTPIGPIDTVAKFLSAAAAPALPAPGPAGTEESYALTGLSADTTYHICLRTADEVPNLSLLSPSLAVKTLPVSPPAAVGGLRGTRDEPAGDFILQWSAVTAYEDGSPVDEDFSAYEIWKAPSLSGAFSPLATVSTDTLSYTDAGSLGSAAVYRVIGGDVFGNDSSTYSLVANGPDRRVILPSPDGSARIEVPASVQGPLFAPGNGQGSDLRLRWSRLAAEEAGSVLLAYELSAIRTSDGSAAALAFPLPGASLVLTPPAGVPRDRIAIFRYNGVEYAMLGGSLSTAQELQAEVTQLGRYRMQQSLRASAFQVTHLEPRKIFTPNGDGINDTITIHFENPGTDAVSGDIFDITGMRVSGLKQGAGDSLVWDGKDASGADARPGIYLYQLRGGDSGSTGTVVLLR